MVFRFHDLLPEQVSYRFHRMGFFGFFSATGDGKVCLCQRCFPGAAGEPAHKNMLQRSLLHHNYGNLFFCFFFLFQFGLRNHLSENDFAKIST